MSIIGGAVEQQIDLESSYSTDEEDKEGENSIDTKNNTVFSVKTPFFTEKNIGVMMKILIQQEII